MLLKFQHFARCCFIGPSDREPAIPSLPDNVLREIILRLPPLPSSLPRASLVCKRWRRLIADPLFLSRFHEHHTHHRTPRPLLGYFVGDTHGPVFVPTLAAPDCIPPERFSLTWQPAAAAAAAGDRLFLLGCRHGLVLLINRRRLHAVVWDPVAGCRATVDYPPEFTTDNGAYCCRGTVLMSTATAGGDGIVGGGDGDVHMMRPFKVILVRTESANNGLIRVSMCAYESHTEEWGRTISIAADIPVTVSNLPSVLIGNARLCGFLRWPKGILELDLENNTLGVIQTPKWLRYLIDKSIFLVVRTQDGGELGLALLSRMTLELWERNKAMASSSAAGWELLRIIQLDDLLSLPRLNRMGRIRCSLTEARILGFDEDNNVIHVSTFVGGAYAIRLDDSMQFTELFNINRIGCYQACYPFTGFYTPGVALLSTA